MTTRVLGRERLALGGREEGRWRATLVHGGVVAALVAGAAALWTAVALIVALLAHPVPTMTTLERDGARGVAKVVRAGTATLVSALGGSARREFGR